MAKYKLYLDDIRTPFDSFTSSKNLIYLEEWVVVTDYESFTKTITNRGLPEIISFDHDLADEHYAIVTEKLWEDYHSKEDRIPTGYDCASWLKRYCIFMSKPIPTYIVHSRSEFGKLHINNILG